MLWAYFDANYNKNLDEFLENDIIVEDQNWNLDKGQRNGSRLEL